MAVQLYEHQIEDLELMRGTDKYALYHQVGAGKSFPCIVRTLEWLAEHGGPIVVLTEISLLGQLRDDYYQVIGNKDEVDIRILTGSTPANQRAIMKKMPPQIAIVNYEYAKQAYEILGGFKLQGIWCDEGHRLKGFRGNRSKYGKRAKVIMAWAHTTPRRLLTTGSPLAQPNKPDIWALYYYLDPRIFGPTLWRFEQEFFYNVVQGQPFKKLVLKPHMHDEVSTRMYGGTRFDGRVARRLTKKDLSDLYGIKFPERGDPIRYECMMSPKLAKVYKELAQQALTVAEGEVITRPMLLGRLNTLQQAASGFIIERDSVDPLGLMRDEKTRRIIEIDPMHKGRVVQNIMEEIEDEPCIIWAVYTHEIDWLMKFVADLRGEIPVRADGKCKGQEREDGVNAFKAGKKKTLIAHPASLGAGQNLQVAGHAIRWSRTYQPIEWEQTRGRNHRAGKLFHEQIFDHELITPGTRDEDVYHAVLNNEDLSTSITMDWLKKGGHA